MLTPSAAGVLHIGAKERILAASTQARAYHELAAAPAQDLAQAGSVASREQLSYMTNDAGFVAGMCAHACCSC